MRTVCKDILPMFMTRVNKLQKQNLTLTQRKNSAQILHIYPLSVSAEN